MAVLMISEASGVPMQAYDEMAKVILPELKSAPGLVMHTASPFNDGFRVIEIWESGEQANRFFADHVHPRLPPGLKPKRTVTELYGYMRP